MSEILKIKISTEFDTVKQMESVLKKKLKTLEKTSKINLQLDEKNLNKTTKMYTEMFDKLRGQEEKKSQVELKNSQNYEKFWVKALKTREIAELKSYNSIQNAIAKTIASRGKELEAIEKAQGRAQGKVKDQQYLNQQSTMYSQIRNSLNQIYAIKGKLLKSSEQESIVLRKQLKQQYEQLKVLNQQRSSGYGSSSGNNSILQQGIQLRNQLNQKVARYTDNQNKANISTSKFGDFINQNLRSIGMYAVSLVGIHQALRKISEGNDFIREANKETTQWQMVTGKTKNEVDKLAEGYKNMSFELGQVSDQTLKSATGFMRQGLGISDVNERLEDTLKLSAVLGSNVSETSEQITAGVNSMGVSSARLGDVVTAIGANAGTSGQEILRVIQLAGSTAKVSGTSLEELASLSAVISENTRLSADTIGVSMNAILNRFLRVKAETGEINKDYDKVIKSIASVGIEVENSETGALKRPMELLNELGSKWDSLSEKKRAYITSAVGVRNFNKFASLLGDLGRQQELLNVAMDSGGTVAEQYAIYLESVEASANRAKTSFQQMYSEAISDDAMKMFYDFSTVVTQSIDKIGLLNAVMFALTTAILSTNKATQGFIASLNFAKLSSFGNSIASTVGSMAMAKSGTEALKIGFISLGTTMDLVKLKTIALQATMTLGLSLAITGIVSGLTKWISASQEAKREQEELLQTTLNNTKQLGSDIQVLNDLANKREELSQKEKEGDNVKKELLETQRELAKMFPELATGIDNEGNMIADNTGLTKELIEEKERLYEKNLKLLAVESESQIKTDEAKLEELKKEEDQLDKTANKQTIYVSGRLKEIDVTEKNTTALKNNLKEQQETIDSLSKAKGILNEYNALKQKNTNETVKNTKANGENSKSVDDMADSTKKTEESIKKYTKAVEDYYKKTNNVQKAINQLNSKHEISQSIIAKIISDYPQMIDALGDEDKMREALIAIMDDETQKVQEAYATKLEASESFYNKSIIGNNSLTNALSKGYIHDLNKFKNVAELKADIDSKLIKQLGENWSQYLGIVIKAGGLTREAYTDIEKQSSGTADFFKNVSGVVKATSDPQMKALIDARNQINEMVSNVSKPLNLREGISSGVGSSKTKKKKEEYISSLSTRYRDLNQSISDTNDLLSKNKSQLDLTDSDHDKIDLLTKQINLYGMQKINLEQLNRERRAERQVLEESLNAKGFKTRIENDQVIIENAEKIKTLHGDTAKEVEGLIKDLDGLNSSIRDSGNEWWSYEKQISDTRSKIKDLAKELRESIAESLSDQKDSYLKGLKEELDDDVEYLEKKIKRIQGIQKDTIDDLKEDLDSLKDDSFDTSEFKDNISDIIQELDKLDDKLGNNADFITSTDDTRSNLSDIKSEIIDIADEVERFSDKSYDNKSRLENLIEDEIDYAEDLQDKLQDVNNTIRDKEKLYKKQEDILEKQIADQEKLENERHENAIKNLDDELDAYQKIINAQLDSLRDEADEEDYNKNLGKEQEELQKIKNKIGILSLDDSLEAKAQRIELEEQYNEQLEKIQEMQNDHTRKLQEDAMEDQLKKYKEDIENKKDTIDEEYDLAKDKINKMKDELTKTKEIHRQELQSLELYKRSLNNLYSNINSNINTKIDDLNDLYQDDIDNLQYRINKAKDKYEEEERDAEKHWDKLIEGAKDGTLKFDNLMDGWYGDSVDKLKEYGINVESEIDKIKGAYGSLGDLEYGDIYNEDVSGGGYDYNIADSNNEHRKYIEDNNIKGGLDNYIKDIVDRVNSGEITKDKAEKEFDRIGVDVDFKKKSSGSSSNNSSSGSDSRLSDKDKGLGGSDRDSISKAKDDYENAKSRGDEKGMQDAHDRAEKIREDNGYSGGTDGSGSYAEGGVVDYTGLAKVHGEKQKSEVVFNSSQAKELYTFVKDKLPTINNMIKTPIPMPKFNLPDFSNIKIPQMQLAGVGDKHIKIDVNIDKFMGTQKEADSIGNKILNGMRKKGGDI